MQSPSPKIDTQMKKLNTISDNCFRPYSKSNKYIINLKFFFYLKRTKRKLAQPRERIELSTPGLQDQCSNRWANEATTFKPFLPSPQAKNNDPSLNSDFLRTGCKFIHRFDGFFGTNIRTSSQLACYVCWWSAAPVSQRSWVQIPYGPEFVSGLIFTAAWVVFITAKIALNLPVNAYFSFPKIA